jgi:hypothetical protein
MRHPLLHLEADARGEMTHYGGLVLAQQFVRRFGVAQRLDQHLHLFKRHAPYYESDHVLALAYTLYADGTCLEDQGALQASEAVRRLVGACRIPDPSTAGDFLRRFKSAADVEQLSAVIDEVQEEAWSKLPRRVRRRRAKHELALVDLDGHIKPLYGEHKEGADFSYDGRWSYQPLVVSLAGSGECLRVVNQPGSARSSDAAAEALRAVLPRVQRHFRNALVRGDTDFDRADVFQQVIDAQAYFAIGGRVYPNRAALAQALPESAWQPFIPRARRGWSSAPARRGRTPNWRKHKAAQRGFRNLRTIGQWIAELSYQPAGLQHPCRMIVRRILIEEEKQGTLFESFRYRLILTNLPRSYTPREIVEFGLPAVRSGKCDRAIRRRDCGLAHAGGGVYGQLGVASDRAPGLESGQVDRPTGVAHRSGALGVEALSAPFRLHRRQSAEKRPPPDRAAYRLASLSARDSRSAQAAAGLGP